MGVFCKTITSDATIKKQALARMKYLDHLLENPPRWIDVSAILAERISLEDSWLIEDTVELEVNTEQQALALEEEAKRQEQIKELKDILSVNDLSIIRALVEQDTKRIEEHKVKQEGLRKTLQTLESSKDL